MQQQQSKQNANNSNCKINFPDLFSKFNSLHSNEHWFTAHSHHFWPDCTEEAVLKYWQDSAKYVDDKWNYFFSTKIPNLKKQLARHLEISNSNQFVFAPNTHELMFRLLTCFSPRNENVNVKKLKVLTTTNEFHSFSRQINLLQQHNYVEIDFISFSDIDDLKKQLSQKLEPMDPKTEKSESYDMIFISHVFFNLGLTIGNDILDLLYLKTINTHTMVVIDAYHSFMALPFSFRKYEDHFFYLAGSYKYAGAGEGLCFLYIPEKFKLKPLYSGWFASFAELENSQNKTHYEEGAGSMAGSTMDFSTLYKLESIFELYENNGISQEDIHNYVLKLQHQFLNLLEKKELLGVLCKEAIKPSSEFEQEFYLHINKDSLVNNVLHMTEPSEITTGMQSASQAHFLCYKLSSSEVCKRIHNELKKIKIFTDYRGSHLRFGFGIFKNLLT